MIDKWKSSNMDDVREQLEYFAKHLELEKERNNEFKNIKEDI